MKPLVRLLQKTAFETVLATLILLTAVALSAAELPKIAEGRPWMAPDIGVSLTPPTGWQIQPNHMGKTLVLQPVPKQEKIKDYSKPIYNRNITLAVIHEARPIDETEALTLRTKLEKDFGQAAGVRDFQVLEHRFIDYRQKADGILLYTAFQLNGFPMSQMHIFLSGSKNSALLTYTDLADAFQNNEDAMNQAWNAMLSTELNGTAPKRYKDLIYSGSALGLMLVSGFLVVLLRRRSAYKMYEVEEEKLYRDDAGAAEEFSSVTGLATVVAQAPVQEETRDVTDVWNLAVSQVSTTLPKARKKRAKSAVETAW
ncbi:MAG TPA: hypothetical protein VE954_07915 [Oligoflexus sp.]|uniref:hypothetical protein n=1 Tax=Oligoflexus sp. TaxID=1971216 RepID=UPI002D3A2D16|nr:hypothetical protein [Oligoflexus sp.]HYX33027.1 hypothetical protein [Oligoflexus sp.]